MRCIFWRTHWTTSCPGTRSAPASAAARRLLISGLLLATGCQTTDAVNRGAYEPNVPPPGGDEFDRSAKILFKRCILAFGEDRWDGVVTDAKRLEAIGKKWGEQRANEPGRAAELRQAAERLQSGSRHLAQAALKADSADVSKALGEVADALTKLHFTDERPAPAA